MALNPNQQAFELINRGFSILIAPSKSFSGDTLAAALGLKLALEKLSKKVDLLIPFQIQESFLFLPKISDIINVETPLSRDFILSIDIQKRKIKEIKYENGDDKLKIYLTPLGEMIRKEDISYELGRVKYDLIITLNCTELESLGEIFQKDPQLFFETPILNIDHHATNEYFGEVNLVEITASSSSEIIVGFLESFRNEIIDQELATIFLAGLISNTNNFRNHFTKPKTLSLAASLMTRGAEHQKVIRHLYKTKKLESLKLLGRVINNIQYNEENKMAWAMITQTDFQETTALVSDIPFVLEELKENFPQLDLALILWEDPDSLQNQEKTIKGIFQSPKQNLLEKLKSELNGVIKNDKLLVKFSEPNINKCLETATSLLREN